jgi:hypothetical protein
MAQVNKPSSPSGAPRAQANKQVVPAGSPRKHRRKGEARELLLAALDSLRDKGKWGETDTGIIKLATISPDSFYRLIRDGGKVQHEFERYRRDSHGRGPQRREDL